jgi:pimeloyl-ACP methyl ester carboxylesterase
MTHEVEEASHFLQEDAPERVVQAIEWFLDTQG